MNKLTRTKSDTVFDIVNYALIIIIMVMIIYPFLNTLAISFNDPIDSIRGGIHILPRQFTTYNYKVILSNSQIYHAFMISVLRTVIAVVLQLFATAMLAYTVSRKEYVLRKFITVVFLMTMYFNGGIIPTYFVIKKMGLINNFWVYIIPGLVSAFNLIVLKSFMERISDSFVESARIDGMNEFGIFIKIMIPLCKPALATIALFIGVFQWNSWFDTFIFASGEPKLSTLQFELMKILSSTMDSGSSAAAMGGQSASSSTVTPIAVRGAITIITTVPVLCLYPFLQKYFISGLTLGGVKG